MLMRSFSRCLVWPEERERESSGAAVVLPKFGNAAAVRTVIDILLRRHPNRVSSFKDVWKQQEKMRWRQLEDERLD